MNDHARPGSETLHCLFLGTHDPPRTHPYVEQSTPTNHVVSSGSNPWIYIGLFHRISPEVYVSTDVQLITSSKTPQEVMQSLTKIVDFDHTYYSILRPDLPD